MKIPSSKLLLSTISIVGPNGISEADFQKFAGFSGAFGDGFEDHARALKYLVLDGTIGASRGKLWIKRLANQEWLFEAIREGDPQSWQLIDRLPSRLWKYHPDDVANLELGLVGESHVLRELRLKIDKDLHDQIKHVSVENDALGYDIASPSPHEARGQVLIEVKTTSRPGQVLNFFLSRNEFEVGIRVPNYFLVFVRVEAGIPRLVGHLGINDVAGRVSSDVEPSFRWQSIRGQVDSRELLAGLP